MELRQDIKLTQQQQLRLTPEITQAIRLLQLSRLELQETVQEEVLQNPVLEQEYQEANTSSLQEAHADPSAEVADKLVPREEEDQQLRALLEQYQTFSNSTNSAIRSREEELPPIESRVIEAPNLYDHLEWQLNLSHLKNRQKEIASRIIEAISPEGYVELSTLEEIGRAVGAHLEEVAEVLYTVQQFDPPGIASVTLRDCLLTQARAFFPDREVLHVLIESHLDALEQQDYARLTKALGISTDELRTLVKLLGTLDPKPGLVYGSEETQYIVPDVYIRKRGDKYLVELNDDGMPRLRISGLYQRLLDGRARGDEAEYLRRKLRQARWLIQSISQRQNTIRRVAEKISEFQRDFLEHGIDHLKPMVLRDIATAIDVHESTVSRVTSNKYVHTPRGLFELKFFFGHRIPGTDGIDHSQLAIKRLIKDWVANEPKAKPYSDQKIKEHLLDVHRVNLSRRTITKYREEMSIPCSSVRKKRL
jgi:RNA polymerase sigma-54 factor